MKLSKYICFRFSPVLISADSCLLQNLNSREALENYLTNCFQEKSRSVFKNLTDKVTES